MLGEVHAIYESMLEQTHLLVAGATGSGKSVVINGMIYNALYNAPGAVNFILLDPKRVELVDYAELPHTLKYASEPDDMVEALQLAMQIVNSRYKEMQKKRIKKYDGGKVYVIIDELADLMTTNAKEVQPLLQRLCQVGRAAEVHVVAATQCPLASVIPTAIKVNFDSKVALRTRSKRDSRNIMDEAGCEELPRYGYGYYITPEGKDLYKIPMYSDDDIREIIDYWMKKRTRRAA